MQKDELRARKEMLELLKSTKDIDTYAASIVRLIPGIDAMYALECTKNSIGTIEEEDFIDFEDDSTYEIIRNIEEGEEIFKKMQYGQEFAILNKKIEFDIDIEDCRKIKVYGKNRYLKS